MAAGLYNQFTAAPFHKANYYFGTYGGGMGAPLQSLEIVLPQILLSTRGMV